MKKLLFAAAIGLGVLTLPVMDSEVSARGGANGKVVDDCLWYKMKAMATKSPKWWAKYRQCIREG